MRSSTCWATRPHGRRPAIAAARSWSGNTARTRFSLLTLMRSSESCASTPPTPKCSCRAKHAMSEMPFIITIDPEGDDLWSKPREITTRNAQYLPRFQSLCERFGFKPVYLTNYEMATSDAFVEFGRDVLARGTGEIGMHLHAWNSPPLVPLTRDDFHYQPYLIEYPEA